MDQNIILLGPCGVGKSTVGKTLSKSLHLPFVDLDRERDRLYKETDYSDSAALKALEKSVIDWHAYQKKYEWYSVRRILEEYTGSVIAFGGGQSVYDGTIYAEPFLQLLKNYRYTFLLLPYDDQIKSIKFLDKRITSKDERTLNRIFISSNTNELSAKEVIFVADKTVPEIADEILQKILEQQV